MALGWLTLSLILLGSLRHPLSDATNGTTSSSVVSTQNEVTTEAQETASVEETTAAETTTTTTLPPTTPYSIEFLLGMTDVELHQFLGAAATGFLCNVAIGRTYAYAFAQRGVAFRYCFCFGVLCPNQTQQEYEKQVSRLNSQLYTPKIFPWTPSQIAAVAVNAFFSAIGSVGNVLVMVTIVFILKMNSVTNLYVFNLAVADFLVCFVCIPFRIYQLIATNWDAGVAVCKFIYYIFFSFFAVSILTITGTAFERYLVICHPMKAKGWTTLYRAKVTVISIWILGFALAIPMCVQVNMRVVIRQCTITQPERLHDFTTQLYYYLTIAVLAIPATLVGFFYISTAVTLMQSITASKSLKGHGAETKKDEKSSSDEKARLAVVRMLIAVWVTFVVCWAPYFIYNLVFRTNAGIYVSVDENYYLQQTFNFMTTFNSALNPILYFIMSRQFREGFFQTLTCKRWQPRKAISSTISSGGQATGVSSVSTRVTSTD